MHRSGTAASFDKRVRRTQAAIKSSFLTLASTKPLAEITVKEVMQLAHVNRATFYAHFSNIEELAAAVELDFAQQLASRCEEALRAQEPQAAAQMASIACDEALRDRASLRWIAGPGTSGCGRDLLRKYAHTRWEAAFRSAESDDLVFDIVFNGCIDLLAKWAQGEISANEEQLKAAICQLVEKLA